MAHLTLLRLPKKWQPIAVVYECQRSMCVLQSRIKSEGKHDIFKQPTLLLKNVYVSKRNCFEFGWFSKLNLTWALKVVSGFALLTLIYKKYDKENADALFKDLIPTAQCLCETINKDPNHLQDKDIQSTVNDRNPQQKIDLSNTTTRNISLSTAIAKSQELCLRRKEEVGSPGIVVCVSVDGRQVYAEGFGYADLENGMPMNPNSVLRIASISKAVTAAIVAKLWEKGQLDLDKPVQEYVSNFPEKRFMDEKVNITSCQLLNHTSGIRHYKAKDDPTSCLDKQLAEMLCGVQEIVDSLFFKTGPTGLHKKDDRVQNKSLKKIEKETSELEREEYYCTKKFKTTADALSMFKDDPLCARPGSKFGYTTFGYTLLAAVVEGVTGDPFTQTVRQTLHHWGLQETYIDLHDPIIYNRARYYVKNKQGSIKNSPYVDNSYKWAGGGILSTAEDVNRFGNILLYSAQHQEKDPGHRGYLKSSTIEKFWQPGGDKDRMKTYGLGFELNPAKESHGMCSTHNFGAGHTGAAVGVSSAMFILPRSLPSTANCCGSKEEIKNTETKSLEGQSVISSTNGSFPARSDPEPQGVVVTVIMNLVNAPARDVADKIARLFSDVDFSL